MIVARENTGSHGFFDETFQPKKNQGHKRTFNKEKLVLLCFVLGLFALGVFIVHYFAQIYTLGHKIERLNQEMAMLRVENQWLEEEVQQIVSLSSIECLALNKLRMVKPEGNDYMLLTMPVAPEQTQPPPAQGAP
jgi:cell division protein FtsL